MGINTTQARSLLTSALVQVYKEMPKPTSFLSSFFKPVESTDKFVSIEVQRGTEKVAVDVIRGEKGNYNKVSRSTEKVIKPPYYAEWFNATDLRLYDVAIGNANASNLVALANEMADEALMVRQKIERAYEKQAADVLETGVITLNNGTTIDFGRSASSIVDNSGTPWSTGTNDPVAQITAGCEYLRTAGKMQGGRVNMICGKSALSALLNNDTFQAQMDVRRIDLGQIKKEQANALGGVPHGIITAGSWDVVIWSYPEYYDVSGTSTPYIADKKVVLIPEAPKFTAGFGAVPQLINEDGSIDQQGAFLMEEYLNKEEASHKVYQKSAGVMIPTALDQIYTMLVLA